MRMKVAQQENKEHVVARTQAPPQSLSATRAGPPNEAAVLLNWQRMQGNHFVQRRLNESTAHGMLRAPVQLWRRGAPALLSERLIQEQEASGRGMGGEERQPENKTGLPDDLKAGVESLSGYAMDEVRVHYNSPKPAELQALAYTQGTEIHVGPGQERHLPHEAWHVVQQAQGRVKPTMQIKNGVPINDDEELEREADEMGGLALQMKTQAPLHMASCHCPACTSVQMKRPRASRSRDADRANNQMAIYAQNNPLNVSRLAWGAGYIARSGAAGIPIIGPTTAHAWDNMINKHKVERVAVPALNNCAESHLWMELVEARQTPRNIDVWVVRVDGRNRTHADSPCANCQQWVHKEFRSINS